jgi:hypothetical protein
MRVKFHDRACQKGYDFYGGPAAGSPATKLERASLQNLTMEG